VKVEVLNLAWAVARAPSVFRFHHALRDPERFQGRWLAAFLKANADTALGRAHGYARATSVAAFRARVPVSTWADVAPWVERIERGERAVLTCEPVRVLERTSGGVAGPKHVPYTQGLLNDFGAATGPWLHDLSRAFPALLRARQYWSLSPVAREPGVTQGGVRLGLEDDTEYFDAASRFAMKRLFAVDGAVARERDLARWRQTTLTQLVAAEDLGFISVWNPSFLTLLLEALEAGWAEMARALPDHRRDAIEARLQRAGRFTAEAVWPQLALVSCWTDAWAGRAVPGLRRFLPHTPIQGKGLLATEGVVSLPLWGQAAPVAAVTSHFLEFEALEGGRIFGVHELTPSAAYAPILTTRGGLARYRLPDVVRCVGFVAGAPLLQFEGRLDRTSDLCGEKLEATFVERAVGQALAQHAAAFVLVSPEPGPVPRYVAWVESAADPSALAQALELRLQDNPHYRYARDLGQLGPLVARQVVDGERKFIAELNARGVRLGDIKPTGFDPQSGWERVFA
jgi:GH3 auxin-responsive promoter